MKFSVQSRYWVMGPCKNVGKFSGYAYQANALDCPYDVYDEYRSKYSESKWKRMTNGKLIEGAKTSGKICTFNFDQYFKISSFSGLADRVAGGNPTVAQTSVVSPNQINYF